MTNPTPEQIADLQQRAEEFRWKGDYPVLCDMKAEDLKRLMADFALAAMREQKP